MPLCRIYTNLSRISFQTEFLKEFVQVLAASLDKPADKISICVIPDSVTIFGGSEAPMAQINVISVDRFRNDAKKMSKYCADINKFVSEKLNISLDRIVIEFTDVKPYEVGRGGEIVAEILAKAK